MTDSNDFDTRTIRHHIRRGETSRTKYSQYLAKLDDCAEMAVETETRFDNPYEKRHSNTAPGGVGVEEADYSNED
jgi:hypothetical protein